MAIPRQLHVSGVGLRLQIAKPESAHIQRMGRESSMQSSNWTWCLTPCVVAAYSLLLAPVFKGEINMETNRKNTSREFNIACRSDTTVLITGPTGSGKTRLAQEIHSRSARKAAPFITINLATLHEGVLESELFGHERGAFTGADHRRPGRLEAAQGGTVFLDEIGELNPRLQARLLEFLQSRTIRAVGGNHEQRLELRIIAATHRDLASAVVAGTFREDLFHRLRVVSLALPSLAELDEDFDSIVHSVLAELSRAARKSIQALAPETANLLEAYPWPGNFRELRNVLEFAVLASQGGVLEPADLPGWFLKEGGETRRKAFAPMPLRAAEASGSPNYQAAMDRFEQEYLSTALLRTGGRVSQAARDIGMSKTTLLRRLQAFAIDAKSFHSTESFLNKTAIFTAEV